MLKIEDLTVVVSGREILTDINLEIGKGEKLALLGPNGSGKTSLLMAIMGFSDYKVTKGNIIFEGRKLNGLSIDERARLGIGIMFQRPPSIRGVKLKQVAASISKNDFDIEKGAGELKLEEFLSRDLNSGFSGGELKRSELFQLLAQSPHLSFFDEPESGVDVENIMLVGKAINRILNNDSKNAALIITHTGYIFDYVKPDKGCVLAGGKIHCTGDPDVILKTVKEHGYERCMTCKGEKLGK